MDAMTKIYEGGVRAFVIAKNNKRRGGISFVKSRPGPASSNSKKTAFWMSSKHAEFAALEEVGCSHCHSIVILFRILPIKHPKAQVPINEKWALGAADMCKMCVERLQKSGRAKNVSWLTPDASSANQLRPAVPTNPVVTASFMRYQNYVKQTKES